MLLDNIFPPLAGKISAMLAGIEVEVFAGGIEGEATRKQFDRYVHFRDVVLFAVTSGHIYTIKTYEDVSIIKKGRKEYYYNDGRIYIAIRPPIIGIRVPFPEMVNKLETYKLYWSLYKQDLEIGMKTRNIWNF